MAGSLLTDEGFGLTIQHARSGRGIAGFMLGSGLSVYLIWNLSTLAGIVFGSALPDPERIGLAFIFPLTFIALMRPLLLNRTALVVAGIGAAAMLVLSEVLNISSRVALPVAACVAALADTLIETRGDR